jgi:UDP:flavonoid glycosyltransferase YjiC (YdhE family)
MRQALWNHSKCPTHIAGRQVSCPNRMTGHHTLVSFENVTSLLSIWMLKWQMFAVSFFGNEIEEFLRAGTPPLYIGFGSIVMEDPASITDIILSTLRKCDVRAIISRGWSNLGEGKEKEENALFIGDCPHGNARMESEFQVH